MVNNTVVRYPKKQKQDVACDESLLDFDLKAICFAGFFPYKKICNTPWKLKLYRAYQITLYILYCPMLISQIVKLYMISDDSQLAIETSTHIVLGVTNYFTLSFINWKKVYKLICRNDTLMQSKLLTEIDSKTREILRETRQKCKFISLLVMILGIVMIFCDFYDIFILHFVENIVGVEHKYKRNTNGMNMFESLLLVKYPFSCWTPFDEKSVMAHLVIYIYTTIPVFMIALKAVSATSILSGILIYKSIQFKFVSKSLEELNNIEDSDNQTGQETLSTAGEENPGEEFSDSNSQVSATDGESFHTPSQEQVPESCNVQQHKDTSITTVQCVKDQEHKEDSDRLPSGKKSSREDCVKTIIKKHQEAIW